MVVDISRLYYDLKLNIVKTHQDVICVEMLNKIIYTSDIRAC